MSQYLEFYIKGKDNQFCPLATYCRCTSYYEAFENYVPSYDGLGAITEKTLGEIRDEITRRIEEIKKGIKRVENNKQDILQANNPLEEKTEALFQCDESIEDYEEELEAVNAVDYFVTFLYTIIEEAEYRSDYDEDKYLYAAIEPMKVKDVDELTEEDRKDWI